MSTGSSLVPEWFINDIILNEAKLITEYRMITTIMKAKFAAELSWKRKDRRKISLTLANTGIIRPVGCSRISLKMDLGQPYSANEKYRLLFYNFSVHQLISVSYFVETFSFRSEKRVILTKYY